MRHKAGDEVHIPAQPIELGDYDRAFTTACLFEGGGQLRSPFQGIRTLACFNLREHATQVEAFRLSKPGEDFLLCLNAKAGAALPAG